MAENSTIEWTDATWNPITGCKIVSPGCTNCYAMGLAGTRLKHIPSRVGLTTDTKAGPVWNGQVRLNEEWLTQPLLWTRPRKIFVCAHGDLFAEGVPDAWIDRVFAVMALTPQHTFQVLTKRAARMRAYLAGCAAPPSDLPLCKPWITQWHRRDGVARAMFDLGEQGFRDRLGKVRSLPLPNVWLGVSAEDQRRADERVPDLLATPAAVRFVSAEPLLGPINFTEIEEGCTRRDIPREYWEAAGDTEEEPPGATTDALAGREYQHHGRWSGDCARLDWVIVGGESGPKARPMEPEWARQIRDACAETGVPYFHKQNGAWIGVDQLRHLEGWTGGPGFGRFDHCRYDRDAECLRVGKKAAGRLLDGRTHDGMPEARP